MVFQFNSVFDVAVSADKSGIIEYWSGAKKDYQFPKCVQFDSKLDTDLFEFVRHKTHPTSLCFSNDGLKFATMSPDRKVRDILSQTLNINVFFFCKSLDLRK